MTFRCNWQYGKGGPYCYNDLNHDGIHKLSPTLYGRTPDSKDQSKWIAGYLPEP
jgi:hypothetical protein